MAAKPRGQYRYRTNTQDMDWAEERVESAHTMQNVGDIERLMSGLLGGGLLVTGLAKRSWTGAVLAIIGATLLQRGATGYCALFHSLGIDTHDQGPSTNRLGRRKIHTGQATKIRRTIEINRPPAELYRFWRSLENLPRVMSYLDSVQVINDRLSHWIVKTLAGAPSVEWDAEIINDIENQRIGWRSLYGSYVDHAGSVEFDPTGNGHRTKLTVTMQYQPPAGQLGTAIAKLFGEDPERKIEQDLQRFKESMEAGAYAR